MKRVQTTLVLLLAGILFPVFMKAQVSRIITLSGSLPLKNVEAEEVLVVGNYRYIFYQVLLDEPGHAQDKLGIMCVDALTNSVVYNKLLSVPAYHSFRVLGVTDGWSGNITGSNNHLYVLFSASNGIQDVYFYAGIDKTNGQALFMEKLPDPYYGIYRRFLISDISYNVYYPNGASQPTPVLLISGLCKEPFVPGLPYSKICFFEKNLLNGTCKAREIYDVSNPNLSFDLKQVILNRANLMSTISYAFIGTVKDVISKRRYGFHISSNNINQNSVSGKYIRVDQFDIRFMQKVHSDGLDYYYGQLFPTAPALDYVSTGKYFTYDADRNQASTYDLDMGDQSLLLRGLKNSDAYGAFVSIHQGQNDKPQVQLAKLTPANLGGMSEVHTYNLAAYNFVWTDPDYRYWRDTWREGAVHIDRTNYQNDPPFTCISSRYLNGTDNNALYWLEVPPQVQDPCEATTRYSEEPSQGLRFDFTGLVQLSSPAFIPQAIAPDLIHTGAVISYICDEPRPTRLSGGSGREKSIANTSGLFDLPLTAEMQNRPTSSFNPLSAHINLEHSEKIRSVYIYDLQGRLIYSKEDLAEKDISLEPDPTKISKGVYVLCIVDETGQTWRQNIYKQ